MLHYEISSLQDTGSSLQLFFKMVYVIYQNLELGLEHYQICLRQIIFYVTSHTPPFLHSSWIVIYFYKFQKMPRMKLNFITLLYVLSLTVLAFMRI